MRSGMWLIGVLFSTIGLSGSVLAASWEGPVVAVLDGDTIDVLHNGQAERIRLNGIDCPEKKQPFGQKAKQFTSALVFGKEVTVHPKTIDRHKRTVGDVLLPDGTHVNQELVKAGLAWWYRKYSDDDTLGDLERDAQQAKLGLWRDPHPIPPWEFRHPAKQAEEIAADGPSEDVAKSEDTTAMQIIGNQQSRVYHRLDCPGYTATKPKNRRMFDSEAEAQAAGYHLAGNCP